MHLSYEQAIIVPHALNLQEYPSATRTQFARISECHTHSICKNIQVPHALNLRNPSANAPNLSEHPSATRTRFTKQKQKNFIWLQNNNSSLY